MASLHKVATNRLPRVTTEQRFNCKRKGRVTHSVLCRKSSRTNFGQHYSDKRLEIMIKKITKSCITQIPQKECPRLRTLKI